MLSHRFARSTLVRLISSCVVLAALGCGETVFDPEPPEELIPPVPDQWSPASGAQGVAVGTVIRITFTKVMDAASFGPSSISISGITSVAIAVSGNQATLTPGGDLDYSTAYTVRVSGSVRSADGTALGSDFNWTFTTENPTTPSWNIPLAVGSRWRYEKNDTNIVVASTTGIQRNYYSGERFVWVGSEAMYDGRPALGVMVFDFEYNATGVDAFTYTETILSLDGTALWRSRAGPSGPVWRPVLSQNSASVGSGSFLLMNGPSKGRNLIFSPRSVNVPAGSFSTIRAAHTSVERGQFASEHWDVDEREYWADGVGPVYAVWNNTFDDKDPARADYFQNGNIALTHAQTGPFPQLGWETSTNDSLTGAVSLGTGRAIVGGAVHITNVGSILSDASVTCQSAPCVHANEQGSIKMQDWYVWEPGTRSNARFELRYDTFDQGVGALNDLDMYVFVEFGSGLWYVGKSVGQAGLAELVSGATTPVRYYIAIQAWSTPGSSVKYWLSVR